MELLMVKVPSSSLAEKNILVILIMELLKEMEYFSGMMAAVGKVLLAVINCTEMEYFIIQGQKHHLIQVTEIIE